ncbi:MAG: hypothetical protein Tsb0027_08280 [Wenzhouxiangellaceae bacterium]
MGATVVRQILNSQILHKFLTIATQRLWLPDAIDYEFNAACEQSLALSRGKNRMGESVARHILNSQILHTFLTIATRRLWLPDAIDYEFNAACEQSLPPFAGEG